MRLPWGTFAIYLTVSLAYNKGVHRPSFPNEDRFFRCLACVMSAAPSFTRDQNDDPDLMGIRGEPRPLTAYERERDTPHAALLQQESLSLEQIFARNQCCELVETCCTELVDPPPHRFDQEQEVHPWTHLAHRHRGHVGHHLPQQGIVRSQRAPYPFIQVIGGKLLDGVLVIDFPTAADCHRYGHGDGFVACRMIAVDGGLALWRSHQLLTGLYLCLERRLGLGKEQGSE